MIILTGYKIENQIYEGNATVIYRGYREIDQEPLIFKLLKKEYPLAEEIARFKREYELTQNLSSIVGVLKVYGLEKYKNTLVMVFEDFAGDSLKNHLALQKLSIEQFLNLSVCITEILGQIHKRSIIHKDINPSNILLNLKTNAVKIIDFGISTELTREVASVLNPEILEGTLSYISPEQTGRMNRSIDYRTDFYSLGITFYEMVTGILPFVSSDPMELVHCHIAKLPVAPTAVNLDIPPTLSKILLRLMAKNAEDRYQTAFGLKWDLQRCLEQMRDRSSANFTIGEKDFSDQFQIPQKLYGREEEVEKVLTAYDEMSNSNSSFLLVAGYSGVGKSALVHEIQKLISQKKAYFTSGKFDQFQRNIPYSALIRCFQNLILQILSESTSRLKYWKEQLMQGLGVNAQIILDLVPELEQIIGKQKAVAELNPTDAKNRFLSTLQNFVKVLANIEHPLVIFLDDLQWADVPTLGFIQELILSKEIQNLLLIGAYRDNEVTDGHPLTLVLSEIQKTKSVQQLFLKPLKEETVNQILADTLHSSLTDTKSLAGHIYRKTNGNPFFVDTLLKSLYQEGQITFIHETGNWVWNLEEIQKYKVSENVVEFLVQELQKLPLETREVLQLASCFGNRIDLKTLSMLYEKTSAITAKALWNAVQKEILIPLDDKYRLTLTNQDASNTPLELDVVFRFPHDRVQQAAYSLLAEGISMSIHLTIGRILLRQLKTGEQEENLVEIVEHWNEGKSLVTDQNEKEELARLNLLVGRKAKASTAFQSALQYLTIGKELLADNSWSLQYNLTFQLFQEFSACAYLCGEYALAESHCEVMLKHAETRLEKVQIRSMQLLQYSYSRKFEEANRAGILGLQLLGIKLSHKPSILAILKEILLAKWNLGKRKIADLINQPIITDPEIKLAMKILIDFTPPSFLTGNSNLFAVTVLKETNLSLVHGNSPEAAAAYVSYAVLLSGLGDLKSANEFGKLALNLNEKFNDMESKCRTLALYTIFCHSWNHHWRTLASLYTQAIEAGLQSGDFLFMAHSCYYVLLWDPEIRLDVAIEKYKKYIALVESSHYLDALDLILIQQNYRLRLLHGQSVTETVSEEELRLKRMKQDHFISGVANHHLYQLQICYAYEDYTCALFHIKEGKKVMHALAGAIFTVDFALYSFLTISALYPKMTFLERLDARRQLKNNYQQMKKWASHCPVNFLHLKLLMEAELARISGKLEKACNLYNEAIKATQKNEYPRYEALANELAGKFFLSRGQERFAEIYLRDAHYGYTRWGATGKVHHLENTYPQFLFKVLPEKNSLKPSMTITSSGEMGTNSLDLASILKSSQVISGEINLKILLRKMLTVVIENAGAERGLLLLEKNKGKKDLVVQAEGFSSDQEPVVLQNIPFEEHPSLPTTIIQYVVRTGQNVVLDDAGKSGLFTKDPHILKHKVKSILCAPILYQNKFTGIIYLENNLTTGAFTEERIETLKVLSAQVAISIENSLLYASLEEKVVERTNQLEDAHKKILVLEKENTEKQLAGGFAHEMRNALVGPKLVIQHVLGQDGIEPYESVGLINSRKLKEIYLLIQNKVPADTLQNTLKAMKVIFENEERIDTSLNMIYKSVSKGLSITQTIMDYAKVGNEQIGKKLIDLNSQIKNLALEYGNDWSLHNISIQLDLTKELSQIHGLETHFDSVFKNLFLNAKDALLDKNLERKERLLKIKTQVIDNIFIANITDNGSGIAPENLGRIYDAFFSTKPDSGTGLGLGIVKKILTLYNGKIDVVSEVGEGTTFTVTLPVKDV